MRTLVTGGAGFIGSHIADALLAKRHEVLVIDDLSRGSRDNLADPVRLEVLDITDPKVDGVIARWQPEAVFHLAAQMDVRASVADPMFDARVNVTGTARIASAAAKAGTGVFVFASTGGAIYGEQEVFGAPEDHPKNPTSPYGVSKLCAEAYVSYFALASEMRTVSMRFANVYGPRQDPHGEAGVVAIFAGRMLRKEVPNINGDGGQTRDYVYVGDVVRACMAAMDNPAARGPYNVGTGIETDVNELAEQLAAQAEYDGPVTHGDGMPGEQRRSCLAVDRARKELDWRPEVDMAAGLKATVEWFRTRS